MNKNFARKAFTLIEVLIVVIIMAVLAATIIPQFSSSTTDAKDSSLQFNLHTIRSQIEMFKVHHNGTYPTLANFADQMTKKTNAAGTVDANGAYGPYSTGDIPANPFNDKNTLTAGDGSAHIDDGTGWQYDASDGGFYPNNSEYYE